MPATLTYPGVYLEEISSGVRTITGVSTSIAAFIDFFGRGPFNRAVQVLSIGDFEREFGGLDARSEASYGVQQFFLNGGSEAWLVRVASTDTVDPTNTPTVSEVFINSALQATPSATRAAAEGAAALIVSAISEGVWGDGLRVSISSDTPVSGEFNMTVTEVRVASGSSSIVRQEVFRNLSMTAANRNFIETVINDPNTGSKLVQVKANGAVAPLANGTLSGPHTADPSLSATPKIKAVLTDGTTPVSGAEQTLSLTAGPQKLTAVAAALEAAIRASVPDNPAFAGATVDIVGNRLRVLPGPGNPANRITFTGSAAAPLKLTAAASIANVRDYNSGAAGIADSAQIFGTAGKDGVAPDAAALTGNLVSKTGIHALEDVDLFNLLCIPCAVELDDPARQAVLSVAQSYCERRRAFFLMDTPPGIDEPQEIKNSLANIPRHRNAALYYPRVRTPDPLDDFRLRSFGASGTLAGVFARTDSERGVWKAPAGTEATLRNVPELDDVLSDPENGTLNPLAINCLRTFPVYGTVCWGARTLDGADQQASEWKYVSVRRLALFLEESLYRGTQWVVFEPNDEPLWAQIRLNLGAFMHTLFRQGAFQGQTPRDAYFVKCDRETTTQTDINLGIVNILVGFAPLKPAEFVVIKIQQMAGQIEV